MVQMLEAGELVVTDAIAAIIDNRSAPYSEGGAKEVFEAAARIVARRGVTN
jgi:hypothetical protein